LKLSQKEKELNLWGDSNAWFEGKFKQNQKRN
jgi:hypothetical protein